MLRFALFAAALGLRVGAGAREEGEGEEEGSDGSHGERVAESTNAKSAQRGLARFPDLEPHESSFAERGELDPHSEALAMEEIAYNFARAAMAEQEEELEAEGSPPMWHPEDHELIARRFARALGTMPIGNFQAAAEQLGIPAPTLIENSTRASWSTYLAGMGAAFEISGRDIRRRAEAH